MLALKNTTERMSISYPQRNADDTHKNHRGKRWIYD